MAHITRKRFDPERRLEAAKLVFEQNHSIR
jgi:transposase-like protein